jgi:hypothetical protein
LLIREGKESLSNPVIKAAVPNKVEDVKGALMHRSLQVTPALALEPCQLNQASLSQGGHGNLNSLPFTLHVQGFTVAGTRDHPQDVEGRLYSQSRRGALQLEIADDGCVGTERDVVTLVPVVEELPRQAG